MLRLLEGGVHFQDGQLGEPGGSGEPMGRAGRVARPGSRPGASDEEASHPGARREDDRFINAYTESNRRTRGCDHNFLPLAQSHWKV